MTEKAEKFTIEHDLTGVLLGEVVRLRAENESLRTELASADESAESFERHYREQAELGEPVVVPTEALHAETERLRVAAVAVLSRLQQAKGPVEPAEPECITAEEATKAIREGAVVTDNDEGGYECHYKIVDWGTILSVEVASGRARVCDSLPPQYSYSIFKAPVAKTPKKSREQVLREALKAGKTLVSSSDGRYHLDATDGKVLLEARCSIDQIVSLPDIQIEGEEE